MKDEKDGRKEEWVEASKEATEGVKEGVGRMEAREEEG